MTAICDAICDLTDLLIPVIERWRPGEFERRPWLVELLWSEPDAICVELFGMEYRDVLREDCEPRPTLGYDWRDAEIDAQDLRLLYEFGPRAWGRLVGR